MLLRPQSCLSQHTGAVSVSAAIRNDRADLPAMLLISYKQPRPGLPVAGLHNMTMSMRRGACAGQYTLYTANWTIPGGISFASKIDIISGERGDVVADDFNDATDLPGTCAPFLGPPEDLCETVVATIPPATSPVLAAPTTMLTTATATTATTPSISMPTPAEAGTATGPPAPAASGRHELGLGHTFKSFFEYMTNYVVNFFFG